MYEKKYLPLTIDCESTMEVSRVDKDMLGDSLLLWCEITCWNTKFGLRLAGNTEYDIWYILPESDLNLHSKESDYEAIFAREKNRL